MSCTLLDLSTEVLIKVFSYLPATDLLSIQCTCRTIRDIVAGTTYIQYILRLHINGVDDTFPPDFPYSERLKLLKRHEQSWKALEFNLFTKCTTSFPANDLYQFILQEGYLIYKEINRFEGMLLYAYADLCSSSQGNELHWVQITIDNSRLPTPRAVVFAVDHDLLVAVSNIDDYGDNGLVQCAFFEFTTGMPHPRSSKYIVPMSDGFYNADVCIEVLGDHILVSLSRGRFDLVLYVVEWKTATVTLLPDTWTTPGDNDMDLVVINDSLIAMFRPNMNGLEIYQFNVAPPDPHLQKLCLLALPTMIPDISITLSHFRVRKEWIPTSKCHGWSDYSQGRHVLPFHSSKVTTIGLHFLYRPYSYAQSRASAFSCAMIISVAALLSTIRSDVCRVPWTDWGPSCTHIYQIASPRTTSAGPFWINIPGPLVVCDYDSLRVKNSRSKLDPRLQPSLYHKTEVYNEFWEAQKIETHLPCDTIVDDNSDLSHFSWLFANREWIVGIDDEPSDLEEGASVTVYHVG